MLEELYDRHDQRIAKVKQVTIVDDISGNRSEMSDWERMTDGESGLQMRRERMELQEMASRELIDEMRQERAELVTKFD